jgi:hypothetical protein
MTRYKNIIQNVLSFFLVNLIGSFVGPVCYALSVVKFGLIEISEDNFSPDVMNHYITTTQMTWAVCALFSLSLFFLKGRWKTAFTLAPIAIPLLYAVTYLVRYM